MAANPSLIRAAIYVRISEDVRNQAGVKRQERECRQLAEDRGWTVVAVYVDNDMEASSGKPRPQYLTMLQAMRDDELDAVIGWHSDRIYRRPDELEDLIKIAEAHDVMFAAVQVGNIDLSTASGRLVARLLGAAAKYEVELKGERQSAQLKDRAHAGLWTGGGTRPFGYEPGYAGIRPDEADVIRTIAERVASGETIGSVTEWLIDEHVPTVRGGQWHPKVVKSLLLNPRIAGLAVYKGEVVGKATWEPIIDDALHKRLVAVISTPSRFAKRTTSIRVAYLSGLIWCDICKYPLITARQQRGPGELVRIYNCGTGRLPGRPGYQKACGGVSIKAEWVEDIVAEEVLARLAKPTATAILNNTATPTYDPAVAEKIEAQLMQLGVDYADQLIGRPEFLAARDRLTERLHAARAAEPVRPMRLPYGDVDALVAWWKAASVGQRAALTKQQIDKVRIGRHVGRRSDKNPERVRIDWK